MAVVVGAVALIAVSYAMAPPIPQDPHYHLFASRSTALGVPNFWNVISNLPFFAVALYGVVALHHRDNFLESWERIAFTTVLEGTAATGMGSAWYHLHPDDSHLFWDRLPMTVVFMALLVMTIGERISRVAGKLLLAPFLLVGLGSVLAWRLTDDLRLYAVVQFGTVLAVVLMISLFPPRYTGTAWIWGAVFLYVAAKLAEVFDVQIARLMPMGGHPLKHLAAACALLVFVHGIKLRQPSDCIIAADLEKRRSALQAVAAEGAHQ